MRKKEKRERERYMRTYIEKNKGQKKEKKVMR